MSLEFPIGQDIFQISTESEFNEAAIEIFRYQYANNKVYNEYVRQIHQISQIHQITDYRDIPFLPIELFKTQIVMSSETGVGSPYTSNPIMFVSSGTTGSVKSKHYVTDLNIYIHSFTKCFEQFYGEIKDYCFIGLLPTADERKDSSLIYMVKHLIEKSKYTESGFYLNNFNELEEVIKKLKVISPKSKDKIIIIGLSYALLDLAESEQISRIKTNFTNLIVMETGGMKGRRKEMVKEELHSVLCEAFGVDMIHSEYGMTELLSQAYSKGGGIYKCPEWMRVICRDVSDPFSPIVSGKTGGINIIDLANVYSCSFIMTNDLGRVHKDNSFEIMGRFDSSDLRGCNMMIE